jgi:hypothetical protein
MFELLDQNDLFRVNTPPPDFYFWGGPEYMGRIQHNDRIFVLRAQRVGFRGHTITPFLILEIYRGESFVGWKEESPAEFEQWKRIGYIARWDLMAWAYENNPEPDAMPQQGAEEQNSG